MSFWEIAARLVIMTAGAFAVVSICRDLETIKQWMKDNYHE